MSKLEAIVGQLEEGEVGLAEALARYEEGVGLLKQCYRLLESAERRIGLLSGFDAQGNPVLELLESDSPTSLEEKAASRSRRRTAKSKKTRPSAPAGEPDEIDEPPTLF